MRKWFGIPTLALAAALATTIPAVSSARDRDDHRDGERHEVYRGHDDGRWRDRDGDRDSDRWRFGYYSAPAPAPVPYASGYYDQYGVWHPYAYYQPYGR